MIFPSDGFYVEKCFCLLCVIVEEERKSSGFLREKKREENHLHERGNFYHLFHVILFLNAHEITANIKCQWIYENVMIHFYVFPCSSVVLRNYVLCRV